MPGKIHGDQNGSPEKNEGLNGSAQAGSAAEGENAEGSELTARFKSEIFNWGESLISVLIFFVVVFMFFMRLIGVDGTSMYPTLEDHNVMLTSNWNYVPARGDIVVLNKESFWNGLPIVKRIIALGGDEIDIDFHTGEVFVNGELLDEPYIAEPTAKQEDMTFPQVVPEGCVFVMGDNRNGSTDSRNTALGMVDERYILGHVLTIVYPLDKIGAL